MKDPLEQYLGDGLYVTFDGYQLEVFASNGISTSNVIYMEPEVFAALLSYVKHLGERIDKVELNFGGIDNFTLKKEAPENE